MSGALSYSSGESATPLPGDTIGGNLDATVRTFGDREALVDLRGAILVNIDPGSRSPITPR